MSDRRTSYYLDKRNGKVKGVLAGVADYFDVDVLWVRLGFMMTLFFLFPPIFFAYWIVAWTASPKPYSLYAETPDEREFWTMSVSRRSGRSATRGRASARPNAACATSRRMSPVRTAASRTKSTA